MTVFILVLSIVSTNIRQFLVSMSNFLIFCNAIYSAKHKTAFYCFLLLFSSILFAICQSENRSARTYLLPARSESAQDILDKLFHENCLQEFSFCSINNTPLTSLRAQTLLCGVVAPCYQHHTTRLRPQTNAWHVEGLSYCCNKAIQFEVAQ